MSVGTRENPSYEICGLLSSKEQRKSGPRTTLRKVHQHSESAMKLYNSD